MTTIVEFSTAKLLKEKVFDLECYDVVSPIKLFNYKFRISWNYTE